MKLFTVSLMACLSATPGLASANHLAFTAHLKGCSEFVGWGPVALSAATPLVPAGYTIAGASGGTASIVVRTTSCSSLQVAGTPAIPTNLSQIGINLVSPDGTGTINNYTLFYTSNNKFLVDAFWAAGLPALYDPSLTYEYTMNSAGTGGTFYSAAPGSEPSFYPSGHESGHAAYFFYGSEQEPPANSQQLFLANWWYGANQGMKQATTFPHISFGTSTVTFYTSKGSEFGTLIGGNADSNFSILSVRGEYDQADLQVFTSSK